MPRGWAPSRVDNNQSQIVEALRQVGWSVADLSGAGRGVPDLMVGAHEVTILLEVKGPKGKLTPAQTEFSRTWSGGPVLVVTSPQDAINQVEAQLTAWGVY